MSNNLENRLAKIESAALPPFPQFTGIDLIGWIGPEDDEGHRASVENAKAERRLLIVFCPPGKVF